MLWKSLVMTSTRATVESKHLTDDAFLFIWICTDYNQRRHQKCPTYFSVCYVSLRSCSLYGQVTISCPLL